MCGIVGYVGTKQAVPILINGLSALEYRGYDSAGICVPEKDSLRVIKAKGPLSQLIEKLEQQPNLTATTGIGHTRWATHGAPSEHNAHPHISKDGLYTIVHNGIIENYISLKEALLGDGYRFQSETDTEVIAQLLHKNHTGDPITTIWKTVSLLQGSYALGILCKTEPNTLYAIRKESPLVLGKCQHGAFLASDIPAILPHTGTVFFLENEELAILKPDGIRIETPAGKTVNKEPFKVDWSVDEAQKAGYEHFMQKEMAEQAEAVKKTIHSYLENDEIRLGFPLSKEFFNRFHRLRIVACGSAYHAGVLGKYMLEAYTKLPVEVEIASEFRYRSLQIDAHTLLIAVSQSGETADTLAALRKAKEKGAFCVGVVNVVGSTLAREADQVLYTLAGPEISVATTKAYSAQLAVFYLLTLGIARAQGTLTKEEYRHLLNELKKLPSAIANMMKHLSFQKESAKLLAQAKHIFFIGRGYDYGVCLEGALKLKEISYLPADAYAAGELKHGPISLIEEGTPVIVLATDEELFSKTLSNLREVKARGARILLITNQAHIPEEIPADRVFLLPSFSPVLMPSLGVLPLQQIAYQVAKCRGAEIDRPRNLAKSVTVE